MSDRLVRDMPATLGSQIFEDLGFSCETNHASYVNRMDNTFGRDGSKFMDAIDKMNANKSHANSEVMRAIYKKKNKNWRMSLYISLHQELNKHRALLDWVDSKDFLELNSAIDIGCDVGTFTCGLARLFPNSQVSGFDRVRGAIQNGKRLARSKNISNAKFFVFELGNASHIPETQYQLGIAPFVLQEVFRNTLSGAAPGNEELTAAEQLSGLIEENGLLISVDRLPGGRNEAKPMVDFIESHGLKCIEQDALVVPGPTMVESFPVSIFKKCT